MSDIFQEVQEEYRREQMAQAWTKYRVPIVAAAAGLILIVAAYEGWSFWHARMIDSSSRQFEHALLSVQQSQGQAAATAAAAELAKLANEGWGGYPVAARFHEAAVHALAKDKSGAVALYDRLANDGAGGPLLADYARIRAALLLVDTAPIGELQKRLQPLITSDSPWRVEAEEFLAYAFWRSGNKAEALRLFDLIKTNPEATPGTKRRALEFSALINGGMTVADLKVAPAAAATPGEPLVPVLPDFDAPPPAPGATPAPTTPPAAPTTPTP